MTRVLLVISASHDPDLAWRVAEDRSPRKDYVELARATGARILYREAVARRPVTRVVARLGGLPVAQALLAWLERATYDVVFTDAENIGLPLALLFKATGVRRQHVMIGHLLTTGWKRLCLRLFRADSHVDVILCHASLQRWLIERHLGVPRERLVLLPYQVD